MQAEMLYAINLAGAAPASPEHFTATVSVCGRCCALRAQVQSGCTAAGRGTQCIFLASQKALSEVRGKPLAPPISNRPFISGYWLKIFSQSITQAQ